MDLLKTILGDELFAQVDEKINAHNGNEANKENQLKLANLAKGGYVSKDKFSALETTNANNVSQLENANKLIEELKKASKNDANAQQKFTDYENTITDLKAELENTKIENAVQLAVRDAKGVDADYLAYKIKAKVEEKGEKLTLTEDGKIKGIDDILSELKTQYPTQFDTSKGGGKVEPVPLPNLNNDNYSLTKSELLKKPYAERQKIYEENPEAYENAMKS